MKKFILLSLLIILLISCTIDSNKENFSNLLSNINFNNENFRVPDINVNDYINELPYTSLFNIEDIKNMIENKSKNKAIVSKSEAIEDINFLFKILETNYALYSYLDKDSKFSTVKENIITQIETDTITSEVLYNLLLDNLKFINDNHFSIGYKTGYEKSLGSKSYFYSLDNEYYYKDDQGFFINYKKNKIYINSVNDDTNVEKYMNLSINDNGEIIYIIGILLPFTNVNIDYLSFDINISYKHENTIKTDKKSLYRSTPSSNLGNNFSIDIQDDIPILSLRSFSLDNTEKELFLQSAFEFKKYNTNILDLRGNSGGDATLLIKWLENRFGFRPIGNSKKIGLNRFLYNGELPNKDNFNSGNDFFNLTFKDDYYYSSDIDSEHLYENDSIIFVLTDVNQASAGEMFIEYLKNYENVILVGTNTSGTMTGSNYGINFIMPNSTIHFKFGQWLYLYDNGYFQESVGYKPDLWVNGADPLDKTLALIKYYNLK